MQPSGYCSWQACVCERWSQDSTPAGLSKAIASPGWMERESPASWHPKNKCFICDLGDQQLGFCRLDVLDRRWLPKQDSCWLVRADRVPCGRFLKKWKIFFLLLFSLSQHRMETCWNLKKRFREWETISHPFLASNAVFFPGKICAEERKRPRASHKCSVWNPAALWFLKNSIYICKLGRLNSYLVDWE